MPPTTVTRISTRRPLHSPRWTRLEISNYQRQNRQRQNTVKMARRPARCYRYCKNKVRQFFFPGDPFTARMCGVGNVFSHHPMAFSPKRRDAISRREPWEFRDANHHRVFSRTPSRGSTVVFPTRRSGFTISAASARPSTTSLSASTSSPTSMSSLAPRPSRPLVFAPTSESPSARRRHDRNPARIKF